MDDCSNFFDDLQCDMGHSESKGAKKRDKSVSGGKQSRGVATSFHGRSAGRRGVVWSIYTSCATQKGDVWATITN
ncbi:unnamed protein product [Leptidea sinapis]|uniref:Uncharacterized protein n=1 Tax=Leptidea sinapis TaxID=189913 RepID=A0A5E4QDF0_9NEOP|nr:unnamed protein product [Leptidea sinapis]